MSTKASPPTSSATAATNSSAATTTSGGVIKIKSELPSDEIKEYAENTMNELLGWYGFDGVDRLDLSSKTSRLLHSSSSANTMSHHQMEKRRSRNRAATLLNLQQHNLRNNNNNNSSSSNNNNNNNNYSNIRISSNKNNVHNNNNNNNSNTNSFHSHNIGGCGGGNESTTSDHDTRSSREDDSKSPHSAGKTTIDEKIDYNNCCWCRRTVPENAPEFLTTTDGPRYCSESCFTQSRRASFKKAKTCDWCKHVRHAVSYVDFQDGASQLQFCSDKCLNQYKMQIFCKETQAHLDMNPHLREQGLEAAASGNGAGLITPDLWLRNCRSRSASPASTLSVSPAPPTSMSTISAPIARLSPPALSQASSEHKPMISVTPASKLMSKSPGIMSSNRQSPKHSRKKRPLRSSIGSSEAGCSMKMNHGSLRREVGGGLGASGASQLLNSSKSLLSVGKTNSLRSSPGQTSNANSSSSSLKLASTPSLSQFAASSVQDLHMSVPPLSPMLEQQLPPPQHQHSVRGAAHSDVGGRGTSIPSAFFATPPSGSQHGSVPHQPTPQLGAGFPTRPPFLQHPPMGGIPRFMASMGFPHMQQPPLMHPDMCGLPSFLGAPPPVTVMVPYPIIIPLPIPIPVPLPIIDFYRAHLTPEQRQNLKQEEQQERERETKQKSEFDTEATSTEPPLTEMDDENATDEPLDCTKSRESPTNCGQNLPRTPTPESASLEPTEEQQRLAADTEHADDPALEEKPTHHIVSSIEEREDATPGGCNSGANNPDDPDNPNEEDTNQKLPKLKITRLHTKRTLLQTKESECSRPLRKRKRIIDCDFQKIALSNKESEQEEFDNTNTVAGSSQTKNSSKK